MPEKVCVQKIIGSLKTHCQVPPSSWQFRKWQGVLSRDASGQAYSASRLQPQATSAIDNFGY
jgi:hypothetical protein